MKKSRWEECHLTNQMAFIPDGNLVYLYDGQVYIVAVPQKLGDGMSIVKTIPFA